MSYDRFVFSDTPRVPLPFMGKGHEEWSKAWLNWYKLPITKYDRKRLKRRREYRELLLNNLGKGI